MSQGGNAGEGVIGQGSQLWGTVEHQVSQPREPCKICWVKDWHRCKLLTVKDVTATRSAAVTSEHVALPVIARSAVCTSAVRLQMPVTAAETTMSKVSLTESLASLAVTFTDTVSAAVGVPEKVRVAAVKLSHAGRAESSDGVAV